VKRKPKKNESLIMWSSKVKAPEDKAVEVVSVIGAFAALNYEQDQEVCKEVESLRKQVVDLEYQLQKERSEQVVNETLIREQSAEEKN